MDSINQEGELCHKEILPLIVLTVIVIVYAYRKITLICKCISKIAYFLHHKLYKQNKDMQLQSTPIYNQASASTSSLGPITPSVIQPFKTPAFRPSTIMCPLSSHEESQQIELVHVESDIRTISKTVKIN